MAATFELVSVCIAIWWEKSYGCPRHNLGKCKLSLRHRTQILSQINSKLDFPREHARENEQCSPAREWLPSGTRAGLSPPFDAHFHPRVSNAPCSSVPQQKQYSGLTPKLSLPLRPAEMVSMRDTGTRKASQSLKKQRCIYMIDQNPLLGFTANPQVPRTCNFNPGLAPSLILRKGFSDYVSTIVLGFPELRKQWEHQTKEDPIEQSCPSPATGFSPSISLYPTSCREMAKFPLHRSFQNIKEISNIHFLV